MNCPSSQYEYMSLDDFEELLADKPADEKWELIGGRVVRMMVGARWEHKRIIQNLTVALMNEFRLRGSDCRPFDETFSLKQRLLDLACFPDVMVRCGPLPPDATSLERPGRAHRSRVERLRPSRPMGKMGALSEAPSLQHYVLVERDHLAVDVIDRVEGGFFDVRDLAQ